MSVPALKVFEPLLRSSANEGLPGFLKDLESLFDSYARDRKGFLADLTDYVLRGSGKRVRPGLVYVASRFGQADLAAVRETAVAVELIHIATLVHDDLVDEALLRRQRPTVGVKFGNGAAVLLGDFIYAQAFQRLGALGRPDLVRLFADTTMEMCDGEIGQYEGRYRFSLTVEEYLSFLRKKTASLMAASCRAGALLAGAPEPVVRALETFGDRLGLAFQIVDDILDIEGEESVVGKTLHTDLVNGKMTLPLILYAAGLSPAEQKNLFEVLSRPEGKIPDLLQKVRGSGVLDRCRDQVQKVLAEAAEALNVLPDRPAKHLLAEISDRLSRRKA